MKNISNTKSKTVTITGASGLIGKSLIKYLLDKTNYKLILNYLSKKEVPSYVKHSKRCKLIIGDLCDISKCKQLIKNTKILVHLAQSVNPKKYQQNFNKSILFNLEPTFNLFNLLTKSTKKIHLIFPSSGGTVYGEENKSCLETQKNQPISPYGIQKLMLEDYIKLIHNLNKNITANILRISNPYGILLHQGRGQGFIGIAINNILKDIPIQVWDDLSTIRDYIHTNDLCEAFISAINYKNKIEVFNIGSGKGTSLKQIINILATHYKGRMKYKTLKIKKNLFSAKINILNINKARKILKWKPKISIQKGISKMIKNIK